MTLQITRIPQNTKSNKKKWCHEKVKKKEITNHLAMYPASKVRKLINLARHPSKKSSLNLVTQRLIVLIPHDLILTGASRTAPLRSLYR